MRAAPRCRAGCRPSPERLNGSACSAFPLDPCEERHELRLIGQRRKIGLGCEGYAVRVTAVDGAAHRLDRFGPETLCLSGALGQRDSAALGVAPCEIEPQFVIETWLSGITVCKPRRRRGIADVWEDEHQLNLALVVRGIVPGKLLADRACFAEI